MAYIDLVHTGNKLTITLTPEGREELIKYARREDGNSITIFNDQHRELVFTKPHATILEVLLKGHIEAGTCELLDENEAVEIGAFTGSPLIAFGVERWHSDAQIISLDRVYWFPNYQTESELETLLKTGSVTFEGGREVPDPPAEVFECEQCHDKFDSAEVALEHNCV